MDILNKVIKESNIKINVRKSKIKLMGISRKGNKQKVRINGQQVEPTLRQCNIRRCVSRKGRRKN